MLIERRVLFTPQGELRMRALTILIAAGFSVLVFRLFQLQIFRGPEMLRLAEINRTQIIPLSAPRGLVMDRHGDILLDNAPNFSLFYSKPAASQTEEERNLERELVRWFPKQETVLRRKLNEARRTGKMTRVLGGIERSTALALIEKKLALPGVNVVVEPQRRSRHGAFGSHLLGYVDEINPAELERRQDQKYRIGQLIGKTGMERMYDGSLRGEDGGLQFEMNASGRHVQVIRRIPSQSGMHLFLTVDRSLQEAAETGLAASPSQRGAAVAMDPRTGAVLALASAPEFDPSVDVSRHLGDPRLPMFNRALQGSYPPGSVFKIMTAAAGLESVKWDVHKTYYCPGVFRLGAKEFGCWDTHHWRDFKGAVAMSCNVYFFNMGLRMGPDPIEQMARAFGLGEKTGIDLPSESLGLIPGRAWKQRARKDLWYDGDTVNFSIGQGAVSVTPIQVAVMLSAVANGGTVWEPFVMDHIVDREGQVLYQHQPKARKKVVLSSRTWTQLHRSLQAVVLEGSGRGLQRPDLVLGAKTGTAQNPHGKDHAWFVAYGGLPDQEPSLAVVVFVENGGRGSVAGGPITRAIVNAAFPKPPVMEVRP
ncbi:MAG: penicillin-binding protein 2 [Elusimicrobia bacterium]|nr:penicillin-binding protein 2 [Elusimicrobiota bacterium]